MARYWIGIASADHVAGGVAGGFAQLGHGRRAPVTRLERGDRIVYYAPRERLGAGEAVRAFVAIGTITDDAPIEADQGDFHPWRRSVEYDTTASAAPIRPLLDRLDLTRDRGVHWGMLFRRSAIEISRADFDRIDRAMHADR